MASVISKAASYKIIDTDAVKEDNFAISQVKDVLHTADNPPTLYNASDSGPRMVDRQPVSPEPALFGEQGLTVARVVRSTAIRSMPSIIPMPSGAVMVRCN